MRSKKAKPSEEPLDQHVLTILIGNVRSRREAMGIKQRDASVAAGFDRDYWAAFEARRRRNPSLKTLCRMAKILRTPLSVLVTDPADLASENKKATGPAR
jgi:transcriptional regulator with XRE-family HTH domain